MKTNAFFKTLTALILCAALLVPVALPAVSAETSAKEKYAKAATVEEAVELLAADTAVGEDTCDCGHCPVVVLPGLNHSPSFLCDENDEPVLDADGKRIGGTLLFFDNDAIKSAIIKMIFPLVRMLLTQKDMGFTDVVYECAKEIFSLQSTNPDGSTVRNIRVERYDCPINEIPESATYDKDWIYRMVPMQGYTDIVGEDHAYFFTFSLLGSPVQSAAELDEYIQTVKEQTGHSKVNLLSVSLGGTIFTAYVNEYGWDDINEVVEAVAVHDGSDIIGDFYSREFNLDEKFFYYEYVPSILESENGNPLLGYLVDIAVHIFPRQVFRDTLTRAMDGVLEAMLINCAQFWALVPSERYPELAERYLSDPAHAVLKERTDRFYQAQLALDQNILDMVDDGVEVNIISGANLFYGEERYTFFAVVSSSGKVNSDGIIQLDSTSLGATGAVTGETLGEDYVQKYTNPDYPDYSYISPDGMVDVSTALLPDNTWIFCGQHHEAGNNDAVLNLGVELMTTDLKTVHDNPTVYPQFNGATDTKTLRRYLLPAAYEVDRTLLDANENAELDAAIEQGEKVLEATISDDVKTTAAEDRLIAILRIAGEYPPEEEESVLDKLSFTFVKSMALMVLVVFGSNGFSDGAQHISKAIQLIKSL